MWVVCSPLPTPQAPCTRAATWGKGDFGPTAERDPRCPLGLAPLYRRGVRGWPGRHPAARVLRPGVGRASMPGLAREGVGLPSGLQVLLGSRLDRSRGARPSRRPTFTWASPSCARTTPALRSGLRAPGSGSSAAGSASSAPAWAGQEGRRVRRSPFHLRGARPWNLATTLPSRARRSAFHLGPTLTLPARARPSRMQGRPGQGWRSAFHPGRGARPWAMLAGCRCCAHLGFCFAASLTRPLKGGRVGSSFKSL